MVMKPVRLIDFLGEVHKKGFDLTGCWIEGENWKYLFRGLDDEGYVMVFYGSAFTMRGTISKHKLVHSVSISTSIDKNRLSGKNKTITVHSSNMPKR
jgi:hypothetical protein